MPFLSSVAENSSQIWAPGFERTWAESVSYVEWGEGDF